MRRKTNYSLNIKKIKKSKNSYKLIIIKLNVVKKVNKKKSIKKKKLLIAITIKKKNII
jgi:hypothetical protein